MQTSKNIKVIRDLILTRFGHLDDPRVQGRCSHDLIEILVVSFLALACGFENYSRMHFFCATRFEWLSRYVGLSGGIPSHDTFRRVLGLLEPEGLEDLLRNWARDFSVSSKRLILDGKSNRGTEKNVSKGRRPLHLLNVYDAEHSIVIAQSKANGSGNSEKSAVLECLEQINIKGAVLSLDAGISGKDITDKIVEKKGHYVVPIKSNQSGLFNLIEANQKLFLKSTRYITKEKGHGRNEKRECREARSEKLLSQIKMMRPGIRSVFQITRYREEKDLRPKHLQENTQTPGLRVSEETTYYISDMQLTPSQAINYIREHWYIENKLHWSLDVVFGEDQSTVRDKRASRNLSVLRKLAFNVFETMPNPYPYATGPQPSRQTKMLLAALDIKYLEKIVKSLARPRSEIKV